MGLTYYLKGDYLFPNLTIESSENPIGKYGMLRRTFLKENRSNWYQSMMLTGKLDRHLLEIEKNGTGKDGDFNGETVAEVSGTG